MKKNARSVKSKKATKKNFKFKYRWHRFYLSLLLITSCRIAISGLQSIINKCNRIDSYFIAARVCVVRIREWSEKDTFSSPNLLLMQRYRINYCFWLTHGWAIIVWHVFQFIEPNLKFPPGLNLRVYIVSRCKSTARLLQRKIRWSLLKKNSVKVRHGHSHFNSILLLFAPRFDSFSIPKKKWSKKTMITSIVCVCSTWKRQINFCSCFILGMRQINFLVLSLSYWHFRKSTNDHKKNGSCIRMSAKRTEGDIS